MLNDAEMPTGEILRPLLAAAAMLLHGPWATSAAEPLRRFEYDHLQMGTWFRIVIYAPSDADASAASSAAFARVDALNAALSDYLPSSEVSRLTDPANAGIAAPLSQDLSRVLELVRPIERASGGALDLTIGPLSLLWRDAREQGRPPRAEDIQRAMRAVGYAHLDLDHARHTATPSRPGMRLDLGAVGKGYAADCILAECRQRGLTRVLAVAGGEVVAGDPPPGQEGWLVGLPSPSAKGMPEECLVLSCGAVSTSGDLHQFLTFEGKRYSHVIDPRTGAAVAHGCTVTVVASGTPSDGLVADALATAVSVLGPDDGPELLTRFAPAGARVIRRGAAGPTIIATPAFKKWRVVPRDSRDPAQARRVAPSNPATPAPSVPE